MGIRGFSTWFQEENSASYVPLGECTLDHLYIDMNSILHNIIRKANDPQAFHKMLHNEVKLLLEIISPTKTILLAIDGPAPVAKLLTQKERRMKTALKSKGGALLTGNALTPGTPFMMDVTTSLLYLVSDLLQQPEYQHLHFEVTDSTVQGEGEVKILGRLARHWYPLQPTDRHVIVGSDSDLLLMALMSDVDNMFVFDASQNNGRVDRTCQVLSVAKLHKAWWEIHFSSMKTVGPKVLLPGFKADFALLTVLGRGNDYLPKMLGLTSDSEGRPNLWPTYCRMRCLPDFAKRSLVNRVKGAERVTLDLKMLTQLLKESGCLEHRSSASPVAYAPGTNHAPVNAHKYLHGVLWFLLMYIQGECPDYRFVYDGGAPTAVQLVDAAEKHGEPTISWTHFTSEPKSATPLLPATVALAVLPKRCWHLILPELRPCVENASGPLAEALAECEECTMNAGMVWAANMALRSTAKEIADIELALKRALLRGTGNLTELDRQLTEANEKLSACKAAKAQADNGSQVHKQRSHSTLHFPVDLLEAAVAGVPLSSFTPAHATLMRFGMARVLFHNSRVFAQPLTERPQLGSGLTPGQVRPVEFPLLRPPYRQYRNQIERARVLSVGLMDDRLQVLIVTDNVREVVREYLTDSLQQQQRQYGQLQRQEQRHGHREQHDGERWQSKQQQPQEPRPLPQQQQQRCDGEQWQSKYQQPQQPQLEQQQQQYSNYPRPQSQQHYSQNERSDVRSKGRADAADRWR